MTSRIFYWIALNIWPHMPRDVQFVISRLLGLVSSLRLSRIYIPAYVRRNYAAGHDWSRYVPASGAERYVSFQDFFSRRLRQEPPLTAPACWPCDGLLCDVQEFRGPEADPLTSVKGERRSLRTVFAPFGQAIPEGYWFANIFLHNRDYHRIHAPISGRITGIERIAGELRLLRPWAYRSDPSLPAFTNERVNVTILAGDGRLWFVSIVGGPGVATISLAPGIDVSVQITAGAELGYFHIGSTCCLAMPVQPSAPIKSHVQARATL